MPTVMLIAKPKGSGAEMAGLPLKTLTGGTITLKDGTEVPVDANFFEALKAGDEIVFDGKGYDVEKVSIITKGVMGKVVLMAQE